MKPRVRRSRFLLAQLSHALGGLGRSSCPTGCAGKLPPRAGRLSTLGIAPAVSRPALPLGLQPTLAICVGATDDCSRRKNVPCTSRAVSSIDLQAMLYIPMLQQCSSSPRRRQRRSARPSIRAESSPLRSSCAGASLASPSPRRHGNAPVSLLIGNPWPYRSACRRDCAAAARSDGQRWATAGWRGRTWPGERRCAEGQSGSETGRQVSGGIFWSETISRCGHPIVRSGLPPRGRPDQDVTLQATSHGDRWL